MTSNQRSLESGQLLESSYNDRNFPNNRPQVSHPFGQSPSSLAPILAALSACLGGIMEIIQRFFQKKQGPSSVVVNGKTYTILKSLGEGGFSFVYLIREQGHYGDPKALKRIQVQLPEQEERLLREIQAHGAVSSPHVLKLLDSATVKSRTGQITEGLLILPFYKHGTVQDLIENTPFGEFIPLTRILKITIGVCKGLKAFHQHSPPLAFRDLKPANILLNEDGEAVLMDLGSVTQAVVHLQSRKDAIGLQDLCAETVTAPYRAPELFDPPSQGTIDESSDVWALGCSIYAMAFRESPFDGSMTAAVSGKIKFPARRNPYDAQFCSFLEYIIQADPKKRPSVAQIQQWCESLLSSYSADQSRA